MQRAFAEEGEAMKKNRLVKTNILIGLVCLQALLLLHAWHIRRIIRHR